MNNIDTDLWGKNMWRSIHYICLGYPSNPTIDDKQKYAEFLTNLQYVLPCILCREHFRDELQNYPLTDNVMRTRDSLLSWSILVHNSVNRRLGKSIYNLSNFYNDYLVINKVENKKSILNMQNLTYYGGFLGIIILVIILLRRK